MANKKTTKQFIYKAQQIHGNKYDYSNVVYHTARLKVCILCTECLSEFWQRADHHLFGRSCPTCGGTKKRSKETLLRDAKLVHGDKYDYTKINYLNSYTEIQ